MCSLRDLDSAAAAAAARMDSCRLEVEVTEVGVFGAGVLGGELAAVVKDASSLEGDLGPQSAPLPCRTIIISIK